MIFILGVARSGTTILYQCLSEHKDFAFFCTAWKKKRFRLLPFVPTNVLRLLKRNQPLEGWEWHRFKETEYVDESRNGKAELINEIESCKKWWHRPDFLGKNPVLCLRIRWITNIFPNALYVIIKRNRQANLESLAFHMNCSLTEAEEYREPFEFYLEQDKPIIKNKIELTYEDFIKQPRFFCKKIIECDNHEWNNKQKSIPLTLPNMNFRHRKRSDMT